MHYIVSILMSLSNIIADSSTKAALNNSKSLPKLTSTTYAQAGTSLGQIADNTYVSAKSAISAAGGSDDKFYEPVRAMQKAAIAADPNNAALYNKAAEESIASIPMNASVGLTEYNNTLFDIQNRAKEAVGSAVNTFGASVNKINPTIASSVTSTGMSSLGETSRLIDQSTTAAYNGAANNVKDSVDGVHKAVADKVKAEAAKEELAKNTQTVDLPVSQPEAETEYGDYSDLILTTQDIKEGDPAPEGHNTTDIIYQEVKIYVEGIQVPFESASVNQSIGQLPSASFQIPPQAGLMDIVRYYQPKVHIFYHDANTGGDRLLFWGHIIACNYARSQRAGSATISFECVHKNALLQQLTFEWSAGGAANVTNGGSQTDVNPNQAAVQINNFNSEYSIIRALHGIVGNAEKNSDTIHPLNKDVKNIDPELLQKRFQKFESRLKGMPSVIMNLWNQVKLEVYSDEKMNIVFSKMYAPLVEEGLRFFDRVSGHPHLENQVHLSRVDNCANKSRPEINKYQTMLPPAFRLDIMSAAQTNLAVNTLKSSLGFSGELTSFLDLFMNFYYSIEYEMLTLASPAEVPVDPTDIADPDESEDWAKHERMAIETIIKPQLPFYYSPICNVILPNMFHSITVQQNEMDIPTRFTVIGTAHGQAVNQPHTIGLNYRAPHSIREAIATGRQSLGITQEDKDGKPVNLNETTGSSFNIPGKYELGRGIKHRKIGMPDWLSHFTSDQNQSRDSKSDEELPESGTLGYKNLVNLQLAWRERYGYGLAYEEGETKRVRDDRLEHLNPYSVKSGIMAYERLLFSTADYEYMKESVRSKTGNVECIFNPYIIPGYPMDIIDSSPNNPSFHAMCASVTHSISSRGIATNVSFLAAITYTEMSNYHMLHTHPWLQNALSMVNVRRSDKLSTGGNTEKDLEDTAIKKDKKPDETGKASENGGFFDEKFLREEEAKRLREKERESILSKAYGLTPDPEYDTNEGDVKEGGIEQGLINNPRAKEAADNFYRSVLGIGAVDPGLIYDFDNGRPNPVKRRYGQWIPDSYESLPTDNGGEGNDNLTGVGNLRLVSRQIEGRKSIESKFNLNFIDLTPELYTGHRINYVNPVTTEKSVPLEPGASMFLEYEDIGYFINRSKINKESNT